MRSSVLAGRPDKSLADTPWPIQGLEAVELCPLCKSRRRRLLHEDLSDRTFFCAPGRWKMFDCDNCGSGYLDPRPSSETIGLAYTEYYTHGTQEVAPLARPQFAAAFRERLRRGYSNHRYGTTFAPASRLGFLAGLVWPRMRRAIDWQNYYFTNRPRRILDVGFGAGVFLEQAMNNGWDAVGVDIDPIVVEQARRRGLQVHLGDIENMIARGERFDAVAMSHVIEHVPDPVAVLTAAYKILNPGGIIYIDTPNLDAIGHAVFREHWRGLEPPRHLVIFTWESLERIVRGIGFRTLKRHRRPELTSQMWLASELVKAGIPAGSKTHSASHIPIRTRLHSRLSISTQEFVTLTACKP